MVWAILLLVLTSLPANAGSDVGLFELDGNPVTLRPAENQTLLLHFWATWCPTCVDDLAYLGRAAESCGPVHLRVYAVNVGEDEAAIRDFVRQHDVRLPVLRDPKGRVWRELDGRGVPLNVFWSAAERESDVGPKTAEEWRMRLAELGCEP